MKDITLVEMLKAGVHFGHQKSRWHPKMEPYIFTARNSIYIINLEKTREKLITALDFVRDVASRGGKILFVGAKRQAKSIVKKYADSVGMPFVVERWIGGTFTNYETIQKLIKNYKDLLSQQEKGEFAKYKKKERLKIEEKIAKMKEAVGGITSLESLPDAVFIVDLKQDRTAVREAKKRNIPIVGIADTNVSPEGIKYIIPANDDATKSLEFITSLVAEAIAEGQAEKQKQTTVKAPEDSKDSASPEQNDLAKKDKGDLK
ncbi:30S ribosomal protein S2 [Patescibacteria group bacterium]